MQKLIKELFHIGNELNNLSLGELYPYSDGTMNERLYLTDIMEKIKLAKHYTKQAMEIAALLEFYEEKKDD